MRDWLALPKGSGDEGSMVKSSLALISGTAMSQAIVFLFSPFLSRIFTPADFGDLANFNAWVSILGMLSNFRYEHAIIVANGRIGTNRVLALTVFLSFSSIAVYTLVAGGIYWYGPASGYLGEIRRIVFLIPFGILPLVLISLVTLFNTRIGRFKTLAVLAVIQIVCVVVFQLTFGVLHVAHGLITGVVAGNILTCVIFLAMHLRNHSLWHIGREMRIPLLRSTASKYRNFPRYTLGADAMSIVVQQFVPVFLTAMFSPVVAGLYAFSTRVIRVPMFVIAGSVSTVLRKQAVDHLRRNGSLGSLFRTTVVSLSLLAIGPLVFLWLYSNQLFALVFGDKWIEAGRVVQILSPGIMLEFVAFPMTVLLLVTHNQKYTFRIQLLNLILLLIALSLGKYYWNSFSATCVLIANLSMIAVASGVSRQKFDAGMAV